MLVQLASHWQVLAGYFCNVVLALLHHFPNKVGSCEEDVVGKID